MANWSKYRSDPLFMFAAPLFKPSDDPRSPVQFAADNFFDNIMMTVSKVFGVFLVPIFKIFRLFLDALLQSSDGLFNIKALLANMWNKWNKMVDPFMRRFQLVFHQFRLTFIKLYSAMQRTLGIAVSAIYGGLSTITTMLSFLDLMVNIIIIILITLLVLVMLPPFVLLPVLPLILAAIFMVSQTASAGGVSGMAGIFCFQKTTQIATATGVIPIETVKTGDILYSGARVIGTMKFSQHGEDLYEIDGVIVSGTHIIYKDNVPYHVKDYKGAKLYIGPPITELYCLITSDRKIPVVSTRGIDIYADWEEFSSLEDLEKWHKQVYETLNPNKPYTPPKSVEILHTESVFSGNTGVLTQSGIVSIQDVRSGDWVADEFGNYVRVNGIVEVDRSEVCGAVPLGDNNYMSSAVWFYDEGKWQQTVKNSEIPENIQKWYSLFTENGTFLVQGVNGPKLVRDFTDIGPTKIQETYNWVLESLNKENKKRSVN